MDESRINNKWPVAKEGIPFIIISLIIFLIFLQVEILFLSVLSGIVVLFIVYFFRDPERHATIPDMAVLSPADGKVIQIQHIKNHQNPLGQPAVKISIFMSIFSVHVNRIPASGTIRKISYFPGKFFSADLDKASDQNERNMITLETNNAEKIVFIQIAGLIARRIVCWLKDGGHVQAGQRFGLIRFGSRLEVYLPESAKVTVQQNHKVKAGETIIGYLI